MLHFHPRQDEDNYIASEWGTVFRHQVKTFIECSELTLSDPIQVVFETISDNRKIGEITIPIPRDVYETKEVELADSFTLTFDGDQKFSGRYYIIILNKGEIKVENPPTTESVEDRAHQ